MWYACRPRFNNHHSVMLTSNGSDLDDWLGQGRLQTWHLIGLQLQNDGKMHKLMDNFYWDDDSSKFAWKNDGCQIARNHPGSRMEFITPPPTSVDFSNKTPGSSQNNNCEVPQKYSSKNQLIWNVPPNRLRFHHFWKIIEDWSSYRLAISHMDIENHQFLLRQSSNNKWLVVFFF